MAERKMPTEKNSEPKHTIDTSINQQERFLDDQRRKMHLIETAR